MSGMIPGLMLVTVAGVANAMFTLPMKFARNWAWENIWLMWSLFALLLLPLGMALLSIPSLAAVYQQAGLSTVLIVACCGAGWGLAQVLFGLSVDAIGIGLAFSIVLGLSAAVGSLLPLLQMKHGASSSSATVGVLLGIVLVLAGVTVCAVAGHLREKAQGEQSSNNKPFLVGLLMAVCSGLCAAAMNCGVAFGEPIVKAATAYGANPQQVVNAIWLPLLAAGALPNLLYCVYLLDRKKTWKNFSSSKTPLYSLFALGMAVFWFFSTVLYGIATRWMGDLGVVVGWPVYMSLIVIIASLLGILTGEWKHAGKRPVVLQLVGMLLLVMAVVVFSLAQRSSTHSAELNNRRPAVRLLAANQIEQVQPNVR